MDKKNSGKAKEHQKKDSLLSVSSTNLLCAGLLKLEGHLMEGSNLHFQDDKWWLFAENGEGIIGDLTLEALIKQLGT